MNIEDLTKSFSGSVVRGFSKYGIVFSLFFLLLAFDFVAITSGVSVGRIAALVTIALSFFGVSQWKIRLDFVGGLIAVFTFSCLCSLFSMPPNMGSYFTIFFNIVLLTISCSLSFMSQDITLWKTCMITAAFVLGIMAIISPGQVGTEWVSGRIVPNIMGSQQDPNEFCGYYLLPVAFMTFHGIQKRSPIFAVFLVFFFYTVLMTGSRGGLIAIGVSFIVSLYAAVRNDKHRLLICLVAVFFLLMLAFNFESILRLFPDAISSRFLGSGASTGTAESRMSAWRQIVQAFDKSNILQQLFGHGFGATTLANTAHLVAHNVYVELLYDVGILGLSSFVGMILAACFWALKKGDFVILASILGEAVLFLSLSAFWSKTLWGLLILAYAFVKDSGFDHEH